MVFSVLAACDLNGKCNFELTFPERPSVSELLERAEATLGAEAAARAPPQHAAAPFRVLRTQVFDERIRMWVDLVASGQLQDGCQCYVFQRETPWHRDSPGKIPPAVRPTATAVSPPSQNITPARCSSAGSADRGQSQRVSPSRNQVAYDPAACASQQLQGLLPPRRTVSPGVEPYSSRALSPGADLSPLRARGEDPDALGFAGTPPPQRLDKVRVVFDALDCRQQRRVSAREWRQTAERLRLCGDSGATAFSVETVDDLFRVADTDADGVVCFPEFERFSSSYPKLLDCLYFRLKALRADELREEQAAGARRALAAAESRLAEAQAEAARAEQEAAQQRRACENADCAADEVRRREQAAGDERASAKVRIDEARDRVLAANTERDRIRAAVRATEAGESQAVRQAEAAQKRAKQQQADRDRAQSELDRLRALVAQQEQEVSRQERLCAEAQATADSAQGRVADAQRERAAAVADTEQAQERVAAAEAELRAALDEEARGAQRQREFCRAAAQAQALRAAEEQALLKARAAEQHQRLQAEQAAQAVAEHQQVLEGLDDRAQLTAARRESQDARENKLLAEEVRLQEQRRAVEEKERALLAAHCDFSEDAGRVASPLRGHSLP
eukprot:TRINITY_DN8002_c1_g3_i1.p1 TRINITY_DN8002_c1_g3~~TRINITY_DN8002_c1_g3_i1.p1  ORF type:complete len:622 (+),score=220.91 TRINITY_DN8002_c1_g3_i1:89-1954(+)